MILLSAEDDRCQPTTTEKLTAFVMELMKGHFTECPSLKADLLDVLLTLLATHKNSLSANLKEEFSALVFQMAFASNSCTDDDTPKPAYKKMLRLCARCLIGMGDATLLLDWLDDSAPVWHRVAAVEALGGADEDDDEETEVVCANKENGEATIATPPPELFSRLRNMFVTDASGLNCRLPLMRALTCLCLEEQLGKTDRDLLTASIAAMEECTQRAEVAQAVLLSSAIVHSGLHDQVA